MANGYQAMYSNTTGIENTVNGFRALYSNTIGLRNVANGIYALNSNTTGGYNTANGYNALYSNTTGVGNVANGSQALDENISGDSNTAVGAAALLRNTGDKNVALGYQALFSNTTGNNNIGIGYQAILPSATASNQIRIGNTQITYAGTQVAWTITSDKRLKDNIEESALGLNFINALNPVSYTRRNDDSKKIEYGFIAQEVEQVLKNNNVTNSGIITVDDQDMYSMRYNDIIAPLVKAVQEQQSIIETLTKRLENLEKQLKP